MEERRRTPLKVIMENIGANCFPKETTKPATFEQRLATAKRLDAKIATTAEQEINEVIESFTPEQEINS